MIVLWSSSIAFPPAADGSLMRGYDASLASILPSRPSVARHLFSSTLCPLEQVSSPLYEIGKDSERLSDSSSGDVVIEIVDDDLPPPRAQHPAATAFAAPQHDTPGNTADQSRPSSLQPEEALEPLAEEDHAEADEWCLVSPRPSSDHARGEDGEDSSVVEVFVGPAAPDEDALAASDERQPWIREASPETAAAAAPHPNGSSLLVLAAQQEAATGSGGGSEATAAAAPMGKGSRRSKEQARGGTHCCVMGDRAPTLRLCFLLLRLTNQSLQQLCS